MTRHRRRPVLSLYSGAGGLDIGLEAAGFTTALCVELNADARNTLKQNGKGWRVSDPGDIHELSSNQIMEQASLGPGQLVLLAGGPPCQPFSKSGYWVTGDVKRLDDPRSNTLGAYIRVLESTLPEVVLLENVKGLVYSSKDEGMRLLVDGLERINQKHGTQYIASVIPLNAADYGVPQSRERVFVVAHRDGLLLESPEPTHGLGRPEPHRSAWDAIGDLDSPSWSPELAPRGKWARLLPSIPEGENYQWHTERGEGEPLFGWRTRYWSFLLKLAKDRPSWTIQAQPGPATGPFHWRSRQLSIRELARLQTFPDDYDFFGERRSAHRQIGNAVPPALGELLGLEIRRQFFGDKVRRKLRLTPSRALDVPAAEPVAPVPEEFLRLRGSHRPHPGTGKGPTASRRS